MTYMFHRGETLSVALDCVSGDAAGVSAVTAAMKPLAAGRTAPDPAALAVPLTVTARAGGWTATLAAPACAALTPGSYALGARLTVAGGVVITDAVTLRIVEPVGA